MEGYPPIAAVAGSHFAGTFTPEVDPQRLSLRRVHRASRVHRDCAARTSARYRTPGFRRRSIFERAVPHQLGVDPAITRVVDLFEEDPVEVRAHLRARTIRAHGQQGQGSLPLRLPGVDHPQRQQCAE